MELDKTKTYFITGAAGFIGSFLAKRLLEEGCRVIGIDNINDYYDVNLKYARLEGLKAFENFSFIKGDIGNKELILGLFADHEPDIVVNLAAQAGVKYSIENPDAYIQSNIIGFYNILEACRYHPVDHLLYASSSSVYGANKKVPFAESDFVDNPVSLYAATKKSNELMAYTYSHLYDIPSTGLRFFTVYGPMGRPDMAYFIFADKYFKGETIKIFNNGDFENDMYRDFTYIDDIVEGIIRVTKKPPMILKPKQRVLNIGNNEPIKLMEFITTMEQELSRAYNKDIVFDKEYEPIKPGDVHKTYASIEELNKLTEFKPTTHIREGLRKFSEWYKECLKH